MSASTRPAGTAGAPEPVRGSPGKGAQATGRAPSGIVEPPVRSFAILLGLIALAAFLVRLIAVLRGPGLDSLLGNDDAIYFSGAIALVNGHIPYRDFNTLHPPGIFYLLSPFAAIASATDETTGFAVARIAFMLLGAVNTVLVGLVGRRVGPWTGLLAAAIYAVWMPSLLTERTTYLVAPQTAGLLVAVYQLTARPPAELTLRRAAIAGVSLGVVGAIQVWAVIPATVILLWLLLAARSMPRHAARLGLTYVLTGAVTAFALVAPMLLLAGERMISMIVFAQAGRVGDPGPGLLARLRFLEGIRVGVLTDATPNLFPVVLLVVVGGFVLYTAWRRPVIRPWLAILVAQGAFLLVTPVFFGHYAAWTSPLASLCVAASATYLALAALRPIRLVGAGVAGVVLVTYLLIGIRPHGRALPVDPATPDLATAQCVTADRPILQIATHTLVRSLRNGCWFLPNPRSASHVYNVTRDGGKLPRTEQPEYQAASLDYYTSGDVVMFGRLDDLGLSEATLARIREELPVEEHLGDVLVLRRTGP